MSKVSSYIPKIRANTIALTIAGILSSTTVLAKDTIYTAAPVLTTVTSHPQDGLFAQLRAASAANDVVRAAQLADQLSGYPLASYVAYYRLKPQLFNSDKSPNLNAPDGLIKEFLATYPNEALTDRMHNDYALVLGARQDWAAFRSVYAKFVLKDDMQLKCYEQMANAASGQNVVNATMQLLTESKHANARACQQLLSTLSKNGQLNTEQLNYFAALAAYTSGAQGQSLAAAAGGNASRMASLITQANGDSTGSLGGAVNNSGLSGQQAALANAYYGYSAARRSSNDAASFYRTAIAQDANLKLPDDVLGWQARSGMRVGDWGLVSNAIDKMSESEKSTAIWQYWRGRAFAAQGNKTAANQQYELAAKAFDFYGILAREALGRAVTLPADAPAPTEAELSAARATPGFERARKFQAMNMTLEYNREWNFPLRAMSDRQLLAASEHARRIGFLDRMVNTSDRTKSEFNFHQRYPTPYLSIVERRAGDAGITPAWAYGITRQESRFVQNAKSSANANGLMQIIPETAKIVARKIGLTGFTLDQLNNIDTNIQLGTAYLGQTKDSFGGSLPLASAGYNAGPGRPAQWRRGYVNSVDGAVFAENIPFTETRDYVKKTMSNMIFYHLILDGKAPSLTRIMGTVSP
jgi:soluble lytic murein transglycosylase